jgi:hypothetical protein
VSGVPFDDHHVAVVSLSAFCSSPEHTEPSTLYVTIRMRSEIGGMSRRRTAKCHADLQHRALPQSVLLRASAGPTHMETGYKGARWTRVLQVFVEFEEL